MPVLPHAMGGGLVLIDLESVSHGLLCPPNTGPELVDNEEIFNQWEEIRRGLTITLSLPSDIQ
jgi:hypothetical protein